MTVRTADQDDGGAKGPRGQEEIPKRMLVIEKILDPDHAAAFNLGLLMRRLCGFGTPRGIAPCGHGRTSG